ncbi:MAG: TIM barrel protein [Akkermansiaceae bacterium]|jgi:hydroxypyruvate isomerase|nr:TIM barrel protein [Akkermansiaceae bacterium]
MFRHSVCRWCFDDFSLETLCEKAATIGIHGIDLLHPHEAVVAKTFGLECPITSAPEHESGIGCIENAFNDPDNHNTLEEIYKALIPAAAEAGVPQVICFSGNRCVGSDEEEIHQCTEGLARIIPLAEEHDITLVMELLNSKVDHPAYANDHTAFGRAICEKLDSPRFKLLYDIYHMQVMEGDVIATIRDNHQFISHYHTAGVPGRHEIDDTQELNYPAIVQAIIDTGFTGFVAQEFIPTANDPFASLADAIKRCTPQ